jgi:D-alanyl-D-alanine carboxypeptidase
MKNNRTGHILLIIICLSFAAFGQETANAKIEQVSTTPAAITNNKPVDELLVLFNGKSRSDAARFIRERLEDVMIEESSEEAVINHILKISEQSGGFDILEIKTSKENQIELLAQTRRDGKRVWIKAFLSKKDKEKLRAFEIELVASKAETRIKEWKNLRLTEREAIAEIRENAAQLAGMDKLSGVLLVAKGDKILLHQTYGFAIFSRQRPNRKNTLIPAASMSKMFTATAIAQLIDRGKLSLDDTLDRVLPAYPNKDAARRIKIRHLLSHRAGLGNFFNEEYHRNRDRYVRPADFLPLFANRPLFFEPGTKFSYSNAGMVVLGAVVEQISGQKFEDFLRDNVFRPAGMKDTFYDPAQAPKDRLASLHSRFETNDPLEIEPRRESSNHRIASPAGSTFTTAKDMLLFIRALQKGKLVKPEIMKEFTGQDSATPENGKYIFGFESKIYQGKTGYGHSGGAPGVNTNAITFGDQDYTVVILTNYDPGFAQVFARDVASLMANVRTEVKK